MSLVRDFDDDWTTDEPLAAPDEGAPRTPLEIDGMKVLFDQRITLMPVELASVPPGGPDGK